MNGEIWPDGLYLKNYPKNKGCFQLSKATQSLDDRLKAGHDGKSREQRGLV
jgi:hypothetical protein